MGNESKAIIAGLELVGIIESQAKRIEELEKSLELHRLVRCSVCNTERPDCYVKTHVDGRGVTIHCEDCFTKIKDAEAKVEGLVEQTCEEREDETHCRCWWDAEGPCCNCGLPTEPCAESLQTANAELKEELESRYWTLWRDYEKVKVENATLRAALEAKV